MLNLRTAAALVDAIAWPTHLVLIGDVDQLAPVGAGKPFAELIDSGAVGVTRLTHVFRQAARSGIVRAAHEVNAARVPAGSSEPGGDFFVLERADPARAAEDLIRAVADRAPAAWGVDPIADVQVLAPMYGGPLGIDELNRRLQARLNPEGREVGRRGFRLGDKLISTRNSIELGLTNGTISRLVDFDPQTGALVLRTDVGETVDLPAAKVSELALAYAVSVHRAQGTEVPVVFVVCHRSASGGLSRNLLYTAITRASSRCVVVGETVALNRAVQRPDGGRRHSALSELIRGPAALPPQTSAPASSAE